MGINESVKDKIRKLLFTVNRLDNAAGISDEVSEEAGLAVLTELTLNAQRQALDVMADLSDAEAARLERQSIKEAETAVGDILPPEYVVHTWK